MKYALGRKVMLTSSHSDYFKEQHTLLTATEPSENMLWTTQAGPRSAIGRAPDS